MRKPPRIGGLGGGHLRGGYLPNEGADVRSRVMTCAPGRSRSRCITDATSPKDLPHALLAPLRASTSPDRRHVIIYALERRGHSCRGGLISTTEPERDDRRSVASIDLAGAGIGEVTHSDIDLAVLSETAHSPFTVRALEVQKA